MNGSDQVPLGTIAEVRLGKMLDKAKHRSGKRLPYLRNVNVRWGRVETDDLLEMHFEESELDRFGLREGDVLVCEGGEPGRAAVWDGSLPDLKYQKALHRVRFRVPYAPRLLVYQLELLAKTGGLERHFTGSTIKHFTGEAFKQLPVPLLPLERQEAIIAQIETQFSRLDASVAALKRAQANLKRYRASVLKAACEGRLVPTNTANWSVDPLGRHLMRIEAGKSFKCEERPPATDEVGVVKVSAVTWGEYNEQESKTCLDPGRVDERLFVAEGDFLFSRANTIELVGACVVARTVTKQVMLSDKILRFHFGEDLHPRWALYFLRSQKGRSEIERLATGNQLSMRNIGQERIRQIELPLPPLAEQERIVAEVERRLSAAEAAEKAVQAGLQRAARLRQAVLARAFAGGDAPGKD